MLWCRPAIKQYSSTSPSATEKASSLFVAKECSAIALWEGHGGEVGRVRSWNKKGLGSSKIWSLPFLS